MITRGFMRTRQYFNTIFKESSVTKYMPGKIVFYSPENHNMQNNAGKFGTEAASEVALVFTDCLMQLRGCMNAFTLQLHKMLRY